MTGAAKGRGREKRESARKKHTLLPPRNKESEHRLKMDDSRTSKHKYHFCHRFGLVNGARCSGRVVGLKLPGES